MNWSDLSMKDRASYIKLMVENGIYNLIGTAGSIGASDVFLNSRFHNPKVDRVLDVLGVLQNTGDFIKFGYDTLTEDK